MTLSILDLVFYCGGLFILFLTPGPVWLALGEIIFGLVAASLALGVVVGDILWLFLPLWVLPRLQRNSTRFYLF